MNKGKKSQRNNFRPSRELSDGTAYAGQYKTKIRLPGTPQLLSLVVGAMASAQPISSAQVTSFAARFGSTFDEYRILGADVKIRPVDQLAGITAFFFDEKSTAAPALIDAQERTSVSLCNQGFQRSFKTMKWRARDLLDLQYAAIGTAYTPVTFKAFTNVANYGSAGSFPVWVIETDLIVEFRGLKAV